jgi:hypothetical protein
MKLSIRGLRGFSYESQPHRKATPQSLKLDWIKTIIILRREKKSIIHRYCFYYEWKIWFVSQYHYERDTWYSGSRMEFQCLKVSLQHSHSKLQSRMSVLKNSICVSSQLITKRVASCFDQNRKKNVILSHKY